MMMMMWESDGSLAYLTLLRLESCPMSTPSLSLSLSLSIHGFDQSKKKQEIRIGQDRRSSLSHLPSTHIPDQLGEK